MPVLTALSHPPSRSAAQMPSLVKQIGQTPLVRLKGVAATLAPGVALYAKAEYMNPGGSVKDRPALRMVREGLRRGLLKEGMTLLDATSGNTGIAYAMIASSLGIPVKLALPANASAERKHILRAYGAELILTDPMGGTDEAQRTVRALVAAEPDRYFYPDQYNNDDNWKAHYEGTGPEIWAQTQGRVSHFVAALGTSGTFTGVMRRLKEIDGAITGIAVQPDSPLHGIEGVKHMETAVVPGIYDAGLPDEIAAISTEEAHEMTRRLAREDGLLVGVSAGANVAAALKVGRELDQGVLVTVLCDTGMRYLSEPFWSAA